MLWAKVNTVAEDMEKLKLSVPQKASTCRTYSVMLVGLLQATQSG